MLAFVYRIYRSLAAKKYPQKFIVAQPTEQRLFFVKKVVFLFLEMELLKNERDDGRCVREVRYRPEPIIRRIGPKKVEARWMEFVEHSSADLNDRRIEYENIPRISSIAKILQNSGTIEISRSARGCIRRVSGVLKIKFPLIGRLVEKTIYKQAQRLLLPVFQRNDLYSTEISIP